MLYQLRVQPSPTQSVCHCCTLWQGLCDQLALPHRHKGVGNDVPYFDYFVLVIIANFSSFLLTVKEAEKPLLTNQESNKCKSFNDISIAYLLSIYTLHTYTIPTGVQSILSAQTPTVVDYSDSTPFVVLSDQKVLNNLGYCKIVDLTHCLQFFGNFISDEKSPNIFNSDC